MEARADPTSLCQKLSFLRWRKKKKKRNSCKIGELRNRKLRNKNKEVILQFEISALSPFFQFEILKTFFFGFSAPSP